MFRNSWVSEEIKPILSDSGDSVKGFEQSISFNEKKYIYNFSHQDCDRLNEIIEIQKTFLDLRLEKAETNKLTTESKYFGSYIADKVEVNFNEFISQVDNFVSDTVRKSTIFSWEEQKETLNYSLPDPSIKNEVEINDINDRVKRISNRPGILGLHQIHRISPQNQFQPKVLDFIFPYRLLKIIRKLENDRNILVHESKNLTLHHEKDIKSCEDGISQLHDLYLKRETFFQKKDEELRAWYSSREWFLISVGKYNAQIDIITTSLADGTNLAIEETILRVLSSQKIPGGLPFLFDVNYSAEDKCISVRCQFPELELIPDVQKVIFAPSSIKFREIKVEKALQKQLYNNLIYSITLGSIYSIFRNDKLSHIHSVKFVGLAKQAEHRRINRTNECILYLEVDRAGFYKTDIASDSPREIFKILGGITNAEPSNFSAIPISVKPSLSLVDRKTVFPKSIFKEQVLNLIPWKILRDIAVIQAILMTTGHVSQNVLDFYKPKNFRIFNGFDTYKFFFRNHSIPK